MGAYAQESITVSDTEIAFTDSLINPGNNNTPKKAFFVVEGDSIRFRVDGGIPTSTVGLLAEAGDEVSILGEHDVEKFLAIRVTTDATIQPHYFNGSDDYE